MRGLVCPPPGQHVARPGETPELQEVRWERDGTSHEPDLCHGDQASGEGDSDSKLDWGAVWAAGVGTPANDGCGSISAKGGTKRERGQSSGQKLTSSWEGPCAPEAGPASPLPEGVRTLV